MFNFGASKPRVKGGPGPPPRIATCFGFKTQYNFHIQTNNGNQQSVQNKKRNGKAQEAQLTFAIESKFCEVN